MAYVHGLNVSSGLKRYVLLILVQCRYPLPEWVDINPLLPSEFRYDVICASEARCLQMA